LENYNFISILFLVVSIVVVLEENISLDLIFRALVAMLFLVGVSGNVLNVIS
jgi:hypothetical protein